MDKAKRAEFCEENSALIVNNLIKLKIANTKLSNQLFLRNYAVFLPVAEAMARFSLRFKATLVTPAGNTRSVR